jgi:hypothetical protein
MGRTPPSRVNLKRILDNLRVASRKGDRAALTLAVDQMKTLALSPRYWERYLGLLRNPLARLVDLLVIKQGERIARRVGPSEEGFVPLPTVVARLTRAPPCLPPVQDYAGKARARNGVARSGRARALPRTSHPSSIDTPPSASDTTP